MEELNKVYVDDGLDGHCDYQHVGYWFVRESVSHFGESVTGDLELVTHH